MIVVGVDRWAGRWVGIALRDGQFASAAVGDDIATLVAHFEDPVAIGIDIPIGLPEAGRREAERLVRTEIGARSSSVFWTPVRRAIEATTWEEANAISRATIGEGISKQSYALREAILDVRRWIASTGSAPFEVHPELSFKVMNGSPLPSRKKSWNGAAQRRALLEREGIVIPADLGPPGEAGPDDVLDAAACAWTARRVAMGVGRAVPDSPQDGMAIWA